ncbi:hypothetical protein ACA910_006937 [Epithemia clementina (nom. ined.)]
MLAVLDRVERTSLTAPSQNRPGSLRTSAFTDGPPTAVRNKGKVTFGLETAKATAVSEMREIEQQTSGNYRFLFGALTGASAPTLRSQLDQARIDAVGDGDDSSIILKQDLTSGTNNLDWGFPSALATTGGPTKKSGNRSTSSSTITTTLTSLAQVICLDTSDSFICRAPIGGTGKFCTTQVDKCSVKAHGRAQSFLDTLKEDGIPKLCSSPSLGRTTKRHPLRR